MDTTATHGWSRVGSAFSEFFSDAANKLADDAEWLIKLTDKKYLKTVSIAFNYKERDACPHFCWGSGVSVSIVNTGFWASSIWRRIGFTKNAKEFQYENDGNRC